MLNYVSAQKIYTAFFFSRTSNKVHFNLRVVSLLKSGVTFALFYRSRAPVGYRYGKFITNTSKLTNPFIVGFEYTLHVGLLGSYAI